MKVVSKEEEAAHYAEVVRGGLLGGSVGLAVGLAGVWAGSRRYPLIRNLSLPFKSFLVSSSGTFGAIVVGERWGIEWQRKNNPMHNYIEASNKAAEESRLAQESTKKRVMDWGRQNRYSIVFSSWVAAMGIAMAIVSRNKYISGAQKLVQARVYAQGLTVAVLIATAALETADARAAKGRWEPVLVVDPKDPTHKHMIEKMVEHVDDSNSDNLWKGKSQSSRSSRNLELKNDINSYFARRYGCRRREEIGSKEGPAGEARVQQRRPCLLRSRSWSKGDGLMVLVHLGIVGGGGQ